MKKEIAVIILSTMILGLLSNALAVWKNQAVLGNRVKVVEKRVEKQDTINTELQNKVYDIHWYLIESKGIKIPKKGNR